MLTVNITEGLRKIADRFEVADDNKRKIATIVTGMGIALYISDTFELCRGSVISGDIKLSIINIVNNLNELTPVNQDEVKEYVNKYLTYITRPLTINSVVSKILSTTSLGEIFCMHTELSEADIALMKENHDIVKTMIPLVFPNIAELTTIGK